MAPRRGGSSGGGGSGSGGGISCSACDSPMSTLFFHLYSDANMYGQLVVNAIFAAALIAVSLLNRRPAAKLTHLATFCFFAACVFQCVRWGLSLPDDWVPHGYRYESSVVVLLQRLGWPVLLTALLRAMRPGKILAAGPWLGVLVLGVLNLAYVVYDFILTDAAVKEWELGEVQGPWRLGDRDFALLWTKSMVGRFTDQPGYTPRPLTWSRDWATRFRAERLYLPADSSVFRNRDTQIKIGIAADVVALLLVLAIGGLHVVTWHRQGKAELPRRRVSHLPPCMHTHVFHCLQRADNCFFAEPLGRGRRRPAAVGAVPRRRLGGLVPAQLARHHQRAAVGGVARLLSRDGPDQRLCGHAAVLAAGLPHDGRGLSGGAGVAGADRARGRVRVHRAEHGGGTTQSARGAAAAGAGHEDAGTV